MEAPGNVAQDRGSQHCRPLRFGKSIGGQIALARSAILDRVEDNFSKPNNSEQYALRKALEMLSTLREFAERDIAELKKTVQTQNPNSGMRWAGLWNGTTANS